MRIIRYSGSRPRRRWLRWRHAIALAIACASAYAYVSGVEANPVTGEKQFVAMSVPEEIAAGREAAPILGRQMGGIVVSGDSQAELVAAVGLRLCAANGLSNSRYAFQFHLLDDRETVNAFALPGGQIFITRGLLDKLERECELAAVLSHEMGHVVHRHASEKMALRTLGIRLSAAAGVATDSRDVAAGAMVADTLLQLRYSREDETESDDCGLRYAIQAGYDPRGMLAVFRVLGKLGQGERLPDFLSSHPWPEERLRSAGAYIQRQFPEGVPAHLGQGCALKALPEVQETTVERPSMDTTGF